MGIRDAINVIGNLVTRSDSWANLVTGLGTARDKTTGTTFIPGFQLTSQQLSDLYTHNALARRIVDRPPRECLKGILRVEGFGENDTDVQKYIKPFQLTPKIVRAWAWARLFGGSAMWPLANDGLKLDEPLGEYYSHVESIEIIDKRFLYVKHLYQSGPKTGQPEIYTCGRFNAKQGVFDVHESRLVFFPGAMTEDQVRLNNGHWDHSVLQACIDDLSSAGEVWKNIQWLVSDANQPIWKLKNLWSIAAQGGLEDLKTRYQILDMSRSVGRAVLIDKDEEDFRRESTSFASLPEISDRGWKILAASAEMPVTVLMGESPAGLNATGASDLEWWYALLEADRVQRFEPPVERLLTILLRAEASPVDLEIDFDFSIRWPEMRKPTTKEKAEIYLLQSQGDAINIDKQVVLPEEVAISRFDRPDAELKLSRKALDSRQQILDTDFPTLLAEQKGGSILGSQNPTGMPHSFPSLSTSEDKDSSAAKAAIGTVTKEIPPPPESATFFRGDPGKGQHG